MKNWMPALYLSACLAAGTYGAQAAENQPFHATYGLYAGGVQMVSLQTYFDFPPGDYEVRTNAKTTGVFSKILPWSGTFETKGQGNFLPVRHDYNVTWRGDTETSTFLYEPAGKFKSLTIVKDGEPKENPADIDEIAKGTKDLLSSLASMFTHYEKTGKCAMDVLTFDNARSFIVRYADVGDTVMENAKLSMYTGPAHGCSVEIIPQKGKWPKKPRGWLRIQEQAKEGGKLPVLWLAKPTPDTPAIPVRVDIHTKYGDVIAHLNALK